MKRFIKIWVRETIQLFLILIGIVLILSIFFGVIYWLDSFWIIGYLGITLWSLFWLAGIITLVEYKKK
jgi:hypothetical protein